MPFPSSSNMTSTSTGYDPLEASPEAKRAFLSLAQLGRETPLRDVRELIRSVLIDENLAGLLPALIAHTRNHLHSPAAGGGLGEKLVTTKLICAIALEAGEEAPRVMSPFLPLLPMYGSFKALVDLLAFVDDVAAEELDLPPDTPYQPSTLPTDHPLRVISTTVHACFAEQLRADELSAKAGESVSNASKFAPHEKRGCTFSKHHADAIAQQLFPTTQNVNSVRRQYRQLRSSLNAANGHIAEVFFSARDVHALASDTSRMTAGFRSKCRKAILNRSAKKHGEERCSTDDRRALRDAVLEEAKHAVEDGKTGTVPLPSDLYVLGREAERIAAALAEGVDVRDDALLLNAGYAKLLDSIVATVRKGRESITKLVSMIDDGQARVEEAGIEIEPTNATPAFQVCVEATVENAFLPAVLLAVALRDVEDRHRALLAAEAASGRDAVATRQEAEAMEAESAVAQAVVAGTDMEAEASGGDLGPRDETDVEDRSVIAGDQPPLPVYKTTILVPNASSTTAVPIPPRAEAQAACLDCPFAHTVAALAGRIRSLATTDQHCDFSSLGRAIRDADPAGDAHVLICSSPAAEGDERALGLPEGRTVSVWRPCRARLASEAFNPCAGQNAITGAPVDAKGNPVGSEYDLGRDGGYSGCQVVVLQLYGNFSFDQPKAALEAKGFLVILHRNSPPTPEKLREELASATQLWVISNSSVQLDDRHRRIIMNFWNSGGGLYIFGDNDPFYADANNLLSDIDERLRGEQDASLPPLKLSGNWLGSQDVGPMRKPRTAGFAPGHVLTTGIATSLAEGVTVAEISADVALALGFEEVLREHEGHLVAAFLPAGSGGAARRGPVMVDGAFTKLYCHWQTTGSARFVKNCACLLSTFTRVTREVEVEEELKGEARARANEQEMEEKAAFAVDYLGGTSVSFVDSLIKARIGDLAERVASILGVTNEEEEEEETDRVRDAKKESKSKNDSKEQLSSLDASIVALRKNLESSNYDIVARAVQYMCDEQGKLDLRAGVHAAYLQRLSLQQRTAEKLLGQGVTAGGLSEAGYPAVISTMLREAALATLRNRGRADNPRPAAKKHKRG